MYSSFLMYYYSAAKKSNQDDRAKRDFNMIYLEESFLYFLYTCKALLLINNVMQIFIERSLSFKLHAGVK